VLNVRDAPEHFAVDLVEDGAGTFLWIGGGHPQQPDAMDVRVCYGLVSGLDLLAFGRTITAALKKYEARLTRDRAQTLRVHEQPNRRFHIQRFLQERDAR